MASSLWDTLPIDLQEHIQAMADELVKQTAFWDGIPRDLQTIINSKDVDPADLDDLEDLETLAEQDHDSFFDEEAAIEQGLYDDYMDMCQSARGY